VRTIVVWTFVVWFAPAIAQADAIMGPPADCAPGSQAMSSHWGQWCEDTTCASDADCPALFDLGTRAPITRVCQRTSVCVPHGTTAATGPRTLDSPRGAYRGPGRPVSGTCERDGTCREGICDTAPRCVIQTAAGSPPPTTPTKSASPTPPATTSARPPAPLAPATIDGSPPPSSGESCAIARTERHGAWRAGVFGSLAVFGALLRRAWMRRR
jgi:hypothetical protein